MRVIEQDAFQYGTSDWDDDYLKWGFHDVNTQLIEAESVMQLVPQNIPLKILDLACGLGTHAAYWSQLGNEVIGADISDVFVSKAREIECNAIFEIGDIRNLPYFKQFDVVTWIERSFFDENMIRSIVGYLTDDGRLIIDVRNPDHPGMKHRHSNWRDWHEDSGVYYLESHETDEQSGIRYDEWIEINTCIDTITKKTNSFQPQTLYMIQDMLKRNGFETIELRTMSGDIFCGGSDEYWLWLVASR